MTTTEKEPDAMDPQRVRSVIDRLRRDGFPMSSLDDSVHHDGSVDSVRRISVSTAEGDALRRWILREKPSKTIEVGLAYGVSALHICEALLLSGVEDPLHVVLDPFQVTFANCGLQHLEEAGVMSIIEHHDEISQIVLPAFLKEERKFDFGFVDGNHRFDSVFLDLFYLGRMVRKGGIIALDDYDLPGIKKAVSFFVKNLNWKIEETSPPDVDEHAWVVLRTAEVEDSRHFQYFVNF
jgi:predicted O-methyltransferase YrrM